METESGGMCPTVKPRDEFDVWSSEASHQAISPLAKNADSIEAQ